MGILKILSRSDVSSVPDGIEDDESNETDDVELASTEFTRHTSVVHFTSGVKKEIEWDSMTKSNGQMVLKTYTGYNPNASYTSVLSSQAEITLSAHNYYWFKTTERTEMRIDETGEIWAVDDDS